MSNRPPAAYKDYKWIVADPQLLGGKLAAESLNPSIRQSPKARHWSLVTSHHDRIGGSPRAGSEARRASRQDCPDTCGILVTVKDGRIAGLQGGPAARGRRAALGYT